MRTYGPRYTLPGIRSKPGQLMSTQSAFGPDDKSSFSPKLTNLYPRTAGPFGQYVGVEVERYPPGSVPQGSEPYPADSVILPEVGSAPNEVCEGQKWDSVFDAPSGSDLYYAAPTSWPIQAPIRKIPYAPSVTFPKTSADSNASTASASTSSKLSSPSSLRGIIGPDRVRLRVQSNPSGDVQPAPTAVAPNDGLKIVGYAALGVVLGVAVTVGVKKYLTR